MWLDANFLKISLAINTEPRVADSRDTLLVRCNICSATKEKAIFVVKQNLKNKGYGWKCSSCGDKAKSLNSPKERKAKKIYSREELERFGCVDVTPRPLTKRDPVEIRCHECNIIEISYTPAIRDAFRHYGYGYQCKSCYNGHIASRGDVWRNNVKKAAQSKERKDRAIQMSKDKIPLKKLGNIGRFWDFGTLDTQVTAGSEVVSAKCLKCHQISTKQLKKFIEAQDNETHGCPKCWALFTKTEEYKQIMLDRGPSFSSKAELEILSWVTQELGLAAKKHRSGGHEIDIFIPEKNIGIEYNGLYWHSELHKDKNYHKTKSDYFKSQGIRIIHVFEHIWKFRQDQIKTYIKSALGLNTNRIGARKCLVKEVDSFVAREFLNNTHIQGAPQNIKAAFGLFSNDLLVGVATFGAHHRGKQEIVLNRFACLPDWTISGGLSKITKTASDYFKTDLITWADMSLSTGNGYEKSGWILEEVLDPDYFYTDFDKTFSKQSRRKSAVDTPLGITEREHALLDGVFRIYDCGKTRYLFRYQPQSPE